MIYYLISEKNEYRIYLVKEKDSARFMEQCAHKVLLHACNISVLLDAFDTELGKKFSFGEN